MVRYFFQQDFFDESGAAFSYRRQQALLPQTEFVDIDYSPLSIQGRQLNRETFKYRSRDDLYVRARGVLCKVLLSRPSVDVPRQKRWQHLRRRADDEELSARNHVPGVVIHRSRLAPGAARDEQKRARAQEARA